MIWIGGPWLLVGAAAFIAAVFAFAWSFRCYQRNDEARRIVDGKTQKEWEEELERRYDLYRKRQEARDAKEREAKRVENAKACCLANSTRTRYSRSTLRKTR